jgi:hypothetical protein
MQIPTATVTQLFRPKYIRYAMYHAARGTANCMIVAAALCRRKPCGIASIQGYFIVGFRSEQCYRLWTTTAAWGGEVF